jgi:hypothetical protein
MNRFAPGLTALNLLAMIAFWSQQQVAQGAGRP